MRSQSTLNRVMVWSAQSHYQNQYYLIDNWNLRNKLRWNFNKIRNTAIHENALENCKILAFLFRPQGPCCWIFSPSCAVAHGPFHIENLYHYYIRPVSQMQVPLVACCEPAGKLWQLCKVLYVFEHKKQYLLIHAPFTPIGVFWYISNMLPLIS